MRETPSTDRRHVPGCIDCGRPVDGAEQAFCPHCGQPTPAHRIDWHFLGHELEHSVLHMDRGIFYTLRRLMLRPGILVREYIEGRRAGIVRPVLLLMMTAAAVVVLTRYATGHEVMGDPAPAGAADGTAGIEKVRSAIGAWMNRHFAAGTLLLIPLEAAAFRIAFGRSGGLNYPEWLVITAFLTVQTFVLWMFSIPLQRHFSG